MSIPAFVLTATKAPGEFPERNSAVLPNPQGAAAPFERQASIKLRFVAGNRALGKAVETHRDRFVYGPEPWDLPTALHLRQRQMTELVQPGTTHVKYGPGGLT